MPCSGTRPSRNRGNTEPDGSEHLQRWSTSTVGGGWLQRVKSLNFAPDFANASRVLRELGDAQPMPLDAGCLSSYANCLYKVRTIMPYFVSGTPISKAWMEAGHRLPLWVTESTPVDLYRGLKLLVVDADIPAMSQATAGNLLAYVKSGGCLATWCRPGNIRSKPRRPISDSWPLWGLPVRRSCRSRGTASSRGERARWPAQTLVFNSLYTVAAPAAAETLARLPDGRPCALRCRRGKGEIILFLGELDWEKSSHVLDALCRYRDVRRWCDATDRRFQVFALQHGRRALCVRLLCRSTARYRQAAATGVGQRKSSPSDGARNTR